MPTVYIVQELKRYHCPECDTRNTRWIAKGQYECANGHKYEHGVAKPSTDVTPAAVYGDLAVLIKSNQVGVALQPLVNSLRNQLRNFSDDDFLLPIGDPVAIGVATALAAEANRGRVNLLRWDKQTQRYIKIAVNLRGSET